MFKGLKLFTFLAFFSIFCGQINASPKFVLTGGPGVGKSTIIEELNKLGYKVLPEAFTEVCREAQQAKTFDSILVDGVFVDPAGFQKKLMLKQRQLEESPTGPAFLDRSKVDLVIFGDYYPPKVPQEFYDEAMESKYDLVFLINPLPEQFYQQTELRRESYLESQNLHKFLKEGYENFGYKVIEVPFDTAEKRVQFIIDRVNQIEKL